MSDDPCDSLLFEGNDRPGGHSNLPRETQHGVVEIPVTVNWMVLEVHANFLYRDSWKDLQGCTRGFPAHPGDDPRGAPGKAFETAAAL